MATFISLPPGFYRITTNESTPKHLTVPSKGEQSLDGLSIFVTDGDPAAGRKQIWQVSGSGVITSAFSKTKGAFTRTPSFTSQHVTLGGIVYQWIIRVESFADGVYRGTIMTSDCEQLYWAIHGNKVELQPPADTWPEPQITDFLFQHVPILS